MLAAIDLDTLSSVTGGAPNARGYDPEDNALGRVGPGRGMEWLGNYYTPEALAHDRQVRDAIAGGTHPVLAHAQALPGLVSAAGSYLRARFAPGPSDMQLP